MKLFMDNDKFAKSGLVLWLALILITGLRFRTREVDESLTADLVVVIQIIIALASAVVGFFLTDNFKKWGYGAKIILAYVIIAFASGIFSPYPRLVFGYTILLAGAGFLTIGLIQRTNNLHGMLKLEKAWLITSLFIILTQFVTVYFSEIPTNAEINRLGEGSSSPSMLSFLCAYALGVSFINIKNKWISLLFWIPRLLLIAIILLTKTRMPLALCFIIFFLQLLFRLRQNRIYLTVVLFSALFSILTIAALLYSLDFPFIKELFYQLNRQDPTTIYTLTGRTAIWATTFKILLNNFYRCLIGYGYGISRLILNVEYSKISIAYAFHTHNYFLEHLFNMGILGLTIALLFIAYAANWITNYNKLSVYLFNGFSSRAFTIMILFYFHSITGIPLGGKIYPIAFIIIFYIVALDKKAFLNTNIKQHSNHI